ncbi:MAG: 5-(carboxyamino)imidazole ribonucleotide mutase [Chthoniobacterales bacterium]|nr:5-(carboxyamino)imidazole ribonucleotide mutase [Chthoniobacterales bacterium]
MLKEISKLNPLIGVVMGSKSDWETMMEAAKLLEEFAIPYEAQVLSAHRMPMEMAQYAAEAQKRGLVAIIAGAGGAAHLPGMLAAQTTLPILGVPIKSKTLAGMDSLLSIVQMPAGIPVATFAIGEAGAKNAALFAVALLAQNDPALAKKLTAFRNEQRIKAATSKLGLPKKSKEKKVKSAT